MNALLFAVTLASVLRAEPLPAKEDWKALNMEGAALMGELKYQQNDMDGAKEKFRDSIGRSMELNDPASHWMALDLYRSAEIEAREGRFADARHHLELLLYRYPDSEWSRRGRRLMDLMGAPKGDDEEEEEFTRATPTTDGPEEPLRRLQQAYRDGRTEDALREAHAFRQRFPSHPYAAEVAVLEGSLWLKIGDPGQAGGVLAAATNARDPMVAAQARYLLSGAYLALGDSKAALALIPVVDPAKAPNKWVALSQVWRAAALARAGQNDRAVALYKKVIAADLRSPVVAQAHAALGEHFAAAGKAAEAMAQLVAAGRTAERYGSRNLAAASRLNIAHLLYKDRKLQQAASAYRDFATKHPEDPEHAEALYQRGLALRRAGKRAAAVQSFEDLVALHAGSPPAMSAHLQLGQLYTDLGESDKAIEHYRAMGRQPGASAKDAAGSSPESVLLEAQVHYNAGRYADAIPLYQNFLKSSPDDAKAREIQDLLLLAYWNGAREDPGMMKAVDLYPDRPLAAQIRFELGGRAYKNGDCESAEEQFQRVLSDFPKAAFVADALFYQAECRLRRQDFRGAADAFRRVADEHPNSKLAAKAKFRRATALFDGGDYEESSELYGALGRDKKAGSVAADAAFNRALSLAKTDRKDATLGAFEDLLSRFPKYSRASYAWLQVGLLRQGEGKLAAAADAFDKVKGADRLQALLAAGKCREQLGQRASALKTYQALRKLRPSDDPNRLHGVVRLGLLLELQNKPGEARPLYREVLRLSSNPSITRIAQQRLNGGTSSVAEAEPALP
ncbi:MAG: tetratricopeptide repeat protein [Elusimicrobia bacterium]|nr:tetratricopeptide repeat protein [Elusimicrobiota bacterium]